MASVTERHTDAYSYYIYVLFTIRFLTLLLVIIVTFVCCSPNPLPRNFTSATFLFFDFGKLTGHLLLGETVSVRKGVEPKLFKGFHEQSISLQRTPDTCQ